MKIHSPLKIILLAGMLLGTLLSGASAASVSLKVNTLESAESNMTVPILATQCEGLGALQFTLIYDPAVVEPVSVESGGNLTDGMTEFSIIAPGRLGIAIVSGTPVNKTGELLKVIFKRVKTDEATTDLTITDAKAWDYTNNMEMLVSTEPGTLTLTQKTNPSIAGRIPDAWKNPLMIGAGIFLLLVLLFLLIIFSKRGKKSPPPQTPPSGSFCQKCGAAHDSDARFCPKCGKPT